MSTVVTFAAATFTGVAATAAAANVWLQRRRDRLVLGTHIEIGVSEERALSEGDLIIGTTVEVRHTLRIAVCNHGEASEFVTSVKLSSVAPSALMVSIFKGPPSAEVRSRDVTTFDYCLGGRAAFAWTEPFVVEVILANGRRAAVDSVVGVHPPEHGRTVAIVDPETTEPALVLRPSTRDPRVLEARESEPGG